MGYDDMRKSLRQLSAASMQRYLLDIVLYSEVRLWSIVLCISFVWYGLLLALATLIDYRLPKGAGGLASDSSVVVVDRTVITVAISCLVVWFMAVCLLYFLAYPSIGDLCACCGSSYYDALTQPTGASEPTSRKGVSWAPKNTASTPLMASSERERLPAQTPFGLAAGVLGSPTASTAPTSAGRLAAPGAQHYSLDGGGYGKHGSNPAPASAREGYMRAWAVFMYPVIVLLLVLAQPHSPVHGSSLLVATELYGIGSFFYSLLAWFGAVLDAKPAGGSEEEDWDDTAARLHLRSRALSSQSPEGVQPSSQAQSTGEDNLQQYDRKTACLYRGGYQVGVAAVQRRPLGGRSAEEGAIHSATSSGGASVSSLDSSSGLRRRSTAPQTVLYLVRYEEGEGGRLAAQARAGLQTASMNPFIRALDVRVSLVQADGGVYTHMLSQRSALHISSFVLVALLAIGRSFVSPVAREYLGGATASQMTAHISCFGAALLVYWVVLAILTDTMFSGVIVSYVYCRVWVESMRDLLTVVLVAVEQRACALDGYADSLKLVLAQRSTSWGYCEFVMRSVFGDGPDGYRQMATEGESMNVGADGRRYREFLSRRRAGSSTIDLQLGMNAGWNGERGSAVVEEDSDDEEAAKESTDSQLHGGKPSVRVELGVPDRSVLSIALSEWWRALDGPVTQVVQSLYVKSQSRLALVVAFSVILAVLLVSRYFYLQGDLVALFEDGVTPIAFVVSLLSFGAVIMVLLETLQIKQVVDGGLCSAIARVYLTSKVAAEALELRKEGGTDTALDEIRHALTQMDLIRTALDDSPRVVPLVFGIHVRYELLFSYATTALITALVPFAQQAVVGSG